MRKARLFVGLVVFLLSSMMVMLTGPVTAISEKQEAAISDYCSEIKERLKKLQKDDARVRVNLGGRYETLLSKYILPLNVNLVENSASNADLVENQNTFAEAKKSFTTDYVEYQQKLEELITVDCKSEPKEFYEKLEKVRQERKTVEKDVKKIRNSITKHLKLVKDLKGRIKK